MKLILSNIGWMKDYNGENEADKLLYDSGYNPNIIKSFEEYNFSELDGIYFGYAPKLNSLYNDINFDLDDETLLVWISRKNEKENYRVVGWYDKAEIFERLIDKDMLYEDRTRLTYNVKALVENCLLLPESERKFELNLNGNTKVELMNDDGNQETTSYLDKFSTIYSGGTTYFNEVEILDNDILNSLIEYIKKYNGTKQNIVLGEKELNAVSDEEMETVEDYVEEAENLYDECEDYEALKLYNKAIEKFNNDAELYIYRGTALLGLSKFKEALKCFDKALDTDNGYYSAYYNKGLAYSALGDFKMALENYNAVLLENDEDTDTWFNKGEIYMLIEDFEKAIKCFNNVLEIDPHNAMAYINKADILVALNRNFEADDVLDEFAKNVKDEHHHNH